MEIKDTNGVKEIVLHTGLISTRGIGQIIALLDKFAIEENNIRYNKSRQDKVSMKPWNSWQQQFPTENFPAFEDSLQAKVFKTWTWEWKTKSGLLPKRIAKAIFKLSEVNLSEKQLTMIGTLAKKECNTKGNIYYDIVHEITWERGEFGDSSSCYWQGRKNMRRFIIDHGGGAIRLYHRTDNKNFLNGFEGYARCWFLPLGPSTKYKDLTKVQKEAYSKDRHLSNFKKLEGSYILFNAYGVDLYEFARIIATLSGVNYRMSWANNNGGTTGYFYLNGGHGIVLSPPEELLASKTKPLIDFCLDETKYNEEAAERTHCSDCGIRQLRRDMQMIGENFYCVGCSWKCNYCERGFRIHDVINPRQFSYEGQSRNTSSPPVQYFRYPYEVKYSICFHCAKIDSDNVSNCPCCQRLVSNYSRMSFSSSPFNAMLTDNELWSVFIRDFYQRFSKETPAFPFSIITNYEIKRTDRLCENCCIALDGFFTYEWKGSHGELIKQQQQHSLFDKIGKEKAKEGEKEDPEINGSSGVPENIGEQWLAQIVFQPDQERDPEPHRAIEQIIRNIQPNAMGANPEVPRAEFPRNPAEAGLAGIEDDPRNAHNGDPEGPAIPLPQARGF